ncbi:high nitrogen upregulated cytochrome P450 monooxygenase 2 [Gloeopeniophorella convolvens]|nr:high nitrogen upregulated cytochrome P450 monooxygenase 2 [Gloeopeniophorella convolvens]
MLLSLNEALEGLSPLDVGVLITGTSFIAHLCFRHFEPRAPLPLVALLIIAPLLLSVPISHYVAPPSLAVAIAFTAYESLLVFFTIAYRLSPFHPLAKYPGPLISKTSKWWAAYVTVRGDGQRYMKGLHERYGDVVRVGPNELSIRDASLIHRVLGQGGLPKGPRWEGRPNPPALIAQRDPVKHMHHRKLWNRAFSSASLKEYEVVVAKRIRQLVDCLDNVIQRSGQKDGAELDIGAWMNYFTTDFMGDMAFGGGFELMRDGGDKGGIWKLLESNIHMLSIFANIPYALPLLVFLAGDSGSVQRTRVFSAERVMKRLEMGSKRKDLFYHLSGEELPEGERPAMKAIAMDGMLAIIAGSDTTSSVLTAIIHYLMRYPEVYDHLQQEVDATFPKGEEPLDVLTLSHMEWLNGCINEGLRLQPPVPSGSQRRVGKQGGAKLLGNLFIPEDTQIFLHTYSMHRDPRNFHSPEVFMPERWFSTGAPKGEHNTAAFIPFSYGPTICAGKNLAIMEMRMVLCWLLQHFRFSGVPGFSYERWEESVQDWFVVHHEPLPVKVSHREN